MADILHEQLVSIERKSYHLALLQNHRGRFTRLTEYGNGKRVAVVIPCAGLPEVERILSAMIQADADAEAIE